MTLEIGLGLNIVSIVSLVLLIVKYATDYQKLKDLRCSDKKELLKEIEHNHELFEIHRQDNIVEHERMDGTNKEILGELKKLNEKITQLFERVPKVHK